MPSRSDAAARTGPAAAGNSRMALRFVVLISVVSFFADFTYEGARSELGPYLAMLGANGAVVATVSGFGTLVGYGLRLVSGRAADATGRFWPIAIAGYAVQMAAVPALALARSWPEAAALIVLERVGKAVRNPPRDAMLAAVAPGLGGFGWVFGLHEAMDQSGAMLGPLLVAAVLAWRHSYPLAFAVLLAPALLNLAFVAAARLLHPRPEQAAPPAAPAAPGPLPRSFWVYLAGAALVAAGFADYPLIAYRLGADGIADGSGIAALYAMAMGVGGGGSLLLGRLFDRYGFRVLVVLTLAGAAFAPLVFLGGFWPALAGIAIWGLGMGVHEAIIPAAVAPLVPTGRRASGFGLFTAGYGVAWFLGSAAMGLLFDRSAGLAAAFCVACQFAALPFLVYVARRQGAAPAAGEVT